VSDRPVEPFSLRPLAAEDGMTVAGWRYPGPWAVYDAVAVPRADEGFWAVVDATGELVGFACFGAAARVPGLPELAGTLDVGLGLRPDLTGRGHGAALGRAVVAHARTIAPDERLRCAVQAWNERSLRVARASGFVPVGEHASSGPDAVRYVVLEQR
jgi:RimJ/RimL family protein N-acetyltransferase